MLTALGNVDYLQVQARTQVNSSPILDQPPGFAERLIYYYTSKLFWAWQWEKCPRLSATKSEWIDGSLSGTNKNNNTGPTANRAGQMIIRIPLPWSRPRVFVCRQTSRITGVHWAPCSHNIGAIDSPPHHHTGLLMAVFKTKQHIQEEAPQRPKRRHSYFMSMIAIRK